MRKGKTWVWVRERRKRMNKGIESEAKKHVDLLYLYLAVNRVVPKFVASQQALRQPIENIYKSL